MGKRKFFKSLKGVIFISFFIVFLLTTIIVGFSIFQIIFPHQEKQYKLQIEDVGNRIVAELTNELSSTKYLAEMLSNPMVMLDKSEKKFMKLIPKVIDEHSKKDKVAGGGIWPAPYKFNPKREKRSFFWGRNEKGNLVYYDDYNDLSGFGYHHEEWYVPASFAKPHQVFWSKVYQDPYSKQSMVTCTVPIFKKQEFLGVATVDLKLEWLQHIFQLAGKRINGYVFALDRNNSFISYPHHKEVLESGDGGFNNKFLNIHEFTKKKPEFKVFAKHLALINSQILKTYQSNPDYNPFIASQIADSSHQINLSEAELIVATIQDPLSTKTALSNKLESFSISNDIIYKGQKCFVTVFHMPETYWKVVLVVPYNRLIGPIRFYIYKLIGLVVFFILLTLIGAAYLLNINLLKPIDSVLKSLEDLDEKKSSHDSFEIIIGKNNELGEMATLINKRTKLIQTNEKKYRALFELTKDAIFIHDEKGKIVDMNLTALDMYNVKSKKIALDNYNVEDWSAKENPFESLPKLFEEVMNGTPRNIEWKAKKYNSDETFDVLVSLQKVNAGDKNYIFATVRDLSAIKKVEAEKIRSEKYASAIFKQSPLSMNLIDETGLTVDVNDAWEKLWGIYKNEVIGLFNPLQDKYSIESGWAEYCKKALKGEVVFVDEKEFDPALANKKGRKRVISAIIFPIKNENDEVKQVVVAHQDVTEIVESRINLEAEREKLSVTLRSIGDGVITTDNHGNIDFLNKTAEKLTGWTVDEAKGKHIKEVFHILDETTKEVLQDPVSRVMETGGVVELQENTTLVSQCGMLFRIGDSAAPITNKESKTIGVVIVFRDITEKIRNENELEKVKKLESLGILAGGIAHDFNNLLSGVMGNITVAKKMSDSDSKIFSCLSKADNALDNAVDLTRRLLTFAKGGEPVRKMMDIGKLVKESAEFALHGSNLKLKSLMNNNLKKVYVDSGQVSQVVSNLIINAVQASHDSGFIIIKGENFNNIPQKKIELLPGNYVKITIKDQGEGISPTNLKKIFDPYFTTKQKGTGLGLASVYSIMQKHDGLVEVTSVVKEGTEFVLYFSVGNGEEVIVAETEVEIEKEHTELNRLNVLLMDDDVIVQEMAVSLFEVLGHDIEIAIDGEDAIKKYVRAKNKNKLFDVVIMDLTIPGGMGGKDAVKKLLEIDPFAKAIVSSGYSNDPVMANYKKYGFSACLNKPYRLTEMKEILIKVSSL